MEEQKKEHIDQGSTKPCTKGHEDQCAHAQAQDCNCDCGGANHGTKAQK